MASHARSPSHTARRWSGSTATPTYRPAGAVYRPRRPTETPLYPVVQHHLETFLASSQEADPMGWGVPAWAERDFRSYLRCGILAHGFARLRCTDCGHDRLLAFSCKGRGVCPSCNARRMAEVAAHLTDEVIPHLPVRQWVLSVPKRLRPFLHQTPEVASAVLAIFLRALRSTLEEASPDAPQGSRLGAVSFPQRFGSSLNPHYHYHVLALDGVVSGGVEHGARFHEATALEVRDAEALARTVQLRVLRWFTRRGLLDPDTLANMRTWQGTGGFSVDGSVRIQGEDRAGVERLVRYCARGPLALERLHAPAGIGALTSVEAHLVYRLPEPDVHGRQELRLTPLELLERLARLVPPPRIHRHRYHGILAPNARLRSTVVTIGRPVPDDVPVGVEPPPSPDHASHPVALPGRSHEPGPSGTMPATPRSRPSRMLWAQLLTRIYEVLPLLCTACGGEMRIISFITLPSTVERILLHLDLPHRPPRVSPARGPLQAELDLDQTPAFDLAAPEPIPEYEFDQASPNEWDA